MARVENENREFEAKSLWDSFIIFSPSKRFQSWLDLYFTTIILDNSVKKILEGRGDQRQGDDIRVTWSTQCEKSGRRNEEERNLRDSCDVASVWPNGLLALVTVTNRWSSLGRPKRHYKEFSKCWVWGPCRILVGRYKHVSGKQKRKAESVYNCKTQGDLYTFMNSPNVSCAHFPNEAYS